MACRNGIIPSSIPFEQRYRPPSPRRRRREKMTKVDRLVCGFCGSLLGLMLWTFFYLILVSAALKASGRRQLLQPPANGQAVAMAKAPTDPFDLLPPFWWGGGVALVFAGYGTVVGAERMMDGFDAVLLLECRFSQALTRH